MGPELRGYQDRISMIRIHENSDDNDSSLIDGIEEQDSGTMVNKSQNM